MPIKVKKLLPLTAVVVLLAGAFVAADYFGVFGTQEKSMTEFVEFRVRTLDARTGREITGVNITCFQYNTNSACAQPPSRERGVVRVNLLVEKHVRESLLFQQDAWYSPIKEDELRIMYIHPDYGKPVQRYSISEMMEHPNQTFSVELMPRPVASEPSQNTEAGSGDTES